MKGATLGVEVLNNGLRGKKKLKLKRLNLYQLIHSYRHRLIDWVSVGNVTYSKQHIRKEGRIRLCF